ncbi:acyl-CoA carboxylase subunit beta [Cupriavidus taiwanensis]|uniref:PROPIONYL-COA CARBOXYLASE (BETA SUBUNIT) PROTEIN n=1 Tax=Cupriavidus taiwanensis (strain DSM 17343 / BCRC 17206 / CCUG 44338 / CIP 107171 / LMG 19424 / R1) TaxID=977880 RepID=B3R775_CUPTR|nr:carboxyl transferase domain-containing protein [Cupriavidus taiwanensis]CAQ70775.1 putative PROPIONYL-COA CARBOXYLASE (BETA SUBUNIT) PROTEIN [Cupriavidus taiwanensis LMG 19424]
MRRIESRISTRSESYKANREHNLRLRDEFRATMHDARHVRAERDVKRLRDQGKLLVRERLDLLLDPDTPFLELSPLAANHAQYDAHIKGAGIVSGIGVVNGREVMVLANDSAIKGGAVYPLGARKSIRALKIAMENRLPVVHLVDSAGAYLPMQMDIFHEGGHMFHTQCRLSAAGVEQVAVALGHCTAGGAYVPTLSDYSIMVRGSGAVFLGGPPLVKAATGEDISAAELGGADVHTRISGTADYAVDSESQGIALAREIVGTLRRRTKQPVDMREPEAPYYDPDELYGIIPDDIRKQFDMREVIARLVDGSLFHEYKPDYGTTLVCGYAWLWGYKIGILANNGVLFSEAAEKATNFMELCDRDGVPLLFLHNITGFMIGRDYEHRGITKDGARMIMVQSNVRVPKFSVLCHASFGAGNYGMAGRGYEPRFLFAWPHSQCATMGAEQAARTLAQVRIAALAREGRQPDPAEIQAIHDQIHRDYTRSNSVYHQTSELRDDGVLDMVDTRNALGIALSASLNAPFGERRQGVLRI